MDDLISRQDAIKVIDRERKKKHLFNTAEDGLLEARGIINTLPSTPDTNQHVQHVLCVDLISRQDAVNEIHKYFVEEIDKTPTEIDEDGDELYADMPKVNSLLACNKELSRRIKSLPSAESTGAMDEAIQEYIKDGYMQPIGEDLISRQDVIELVKKSYYDLSDGEEDMWAMVHDVEELPSAQDSRQRGEWIKDPSFDGIRFIPVCSNCGNRPPRIEVGGKLVGGYGAEATGAVWKSELEYHQSDYCPNCGAKMHKGGDDE